MLISFSATHIIWLAFSPDTLSSNFKCVSRYFSLKLDVSTESFVS